MEDLGEKKTQETVSNVCHLFVSSHNPYHAELHADVNRKSQFMLHDLILQQNAWNQQFSKGWLLLSL